MYRDTCFVTWIVVLAFPLSFLFLSSSPLPFLSLKLHCAKVHLLREKNECKQFSSINWLSKSQFRLQFSISPGNFSSQFTVLSGVSWNFQFTGCVRADRTELPCCLWFKCFFCFVIFDRRVYFSRVFMFTWNNLLC